jgi:hypothetical protein
MLCLPETVELLERDTKLSKNLEEKRRADFAPTV